MDFVNGFICPLCGQRARAYWSHLDYHCINHTHVGISMCVCGKIFPNADDRNAHFEQCGKECVLILELGRV
jgi:hypothetical protein